MTARGRRGTDERIAAAFGGAAAARRADALPDGRLPRRSRARGAIGEAYADGGADLVELGVPFSDPLADGPVIHAAGTAALRAGATITGVLGSGARWPSACRWCSMCYANLVFARGVERFADDLARARDRRPDRPGPPAGGGDAVRAACDATGVALVPLVAPTTPDERLARIGAHARGFVYAVSVTGTTGERASLSATCEGLVARAEAVTDVPVALGFGIGTPGQARAAADAGADGVIVGSRLVRAAAEADDPPAAVHALVRAFADALV